MRNLLVICLILTFSVLGFSQAKNAKYVTVPTALSVFGGGGLSIGTIVTDLSTTDTWQLTSYGSASANLAVTSKLLYAADTSYFSKTGNAVHPSVISDSVGIGTTTPGAILEVAGRIEISGTSQSVFIGEDAGVNTKAIYANRNNVYIGYNAAETDTLSADNVVIGANAWSNSTGTNTRRNVILGSGAMGSQVLDGGSNVAIGYFSMYSNTGGQYSTAVGETSMYNNTTGDLNTAIGRGAFDKNTTGSVNIAIGYYSGQYIANGSTHNTNSNNSIFIGSDTWANALGETNQIVIGDSAIGNGSNTATILDDNGTDVYMGEDGQADVHLYGIYDMNEELGTTGQLLSTTGTGTDWIDAGGVGDTSFWSRTLGHIYPSTITDSVGIGITAPTEMLQIAGDLKLVSPTGFGNYAVEIENSQTAGCGVKITTDALGGSPTPAISVRTGAGEISSFDGSGSLMVNTTFKSNDWFNVGVDMLVVNKTSENVGIGVVTPSYKLEVNGHTQTDTLSLSNTSVEVDTIETVLTDSDTKIPTSGAVKDYTSSFVTGLDFTNILAVKIYRATDTLTESANHGHSEYSLQTWADKVDDSLVVHLDTLQAHNARLIALEGIDTTGIFHTNRTALNSVSGTNTGDEVITDNQIVVGTGTGIEGDANLTWNSTTLSVTGDATKLYLDSALMQYPENYNAKETVSMRSLSYIVHDTILHDNTNWRNLFLDGASKQMELSDDTGWTFNILVAGINAEGTEYFSYRIEGFVKRTEATTTIVASTVTVIAESDAAFNCQVAAAAISANSLSIQVMDAGATGDRIIWAAKVDIIEVWAGTL